MEIRTVKSFMTEKELKIEGQTTKYDKFQGRDHP